MTLDRRGFLGALGLGALAARLGLAPAEAQTEAEGMELARLGIVDPERMAMLEGYESAELVAARIAGAHQEDDFELELLVKDLDPGRWYDLLESRELFQLDVCIGSGTYASGVFQVTAFEYPVHHLPKVRVRSAGRVELYAEEPPRGRTPGVGCITATARRRGTSSPWLVSRV
jgi:hypothetical protein